MLPVKLIKICQNDKKNRRLTEASSREQIIAFPLEYYMTDGNPGG